MTQQPRHESLHCVVSASSSPSHVPLPTTATEMPSIKFGATASVMSYAQERANFDCPTSKEEARRT